MSDSLLVVMEEETGEERHVVGVCDVCGANEEDVRAIEFLLSPQGIAHRQNDEIPENTVCGHDATRDGWWWPL